MTETLPPPLGVNCEGITIGDIHNSHVIASEKSLIYRTADLPDCLYRWKDIKSLDLYLPTGRWSRPALADFLVGAFQMAITLSTWTGDAPIGSLTVDANGEAPVQLDITPHYIVGYDSRSATMAVKLLHEIHRDPDLRGLLSNPTAIAAALIRLF